jgi:hypothetical protein
LIFCATPSIYLCIYSKPGGTTQSPSFMSPPTDHLAAAQRQHYHPPAQETLRPRPGNSPTIRTNTARKQSDNPSACAKLTA